MQLLVAGFNGFSQWPFSDNIIEYFQNVDLQGYLQANNIEKELHYLIEWCYNVFNIDGKIYLTGFVHDKYENTSKILIHPDGLKFTHVAGNDKYILLSSDSTVWKYNLFKNDCDQQQQQWQKLPDFLNIVNSLHNDVEMTNSTDDAKEYICKIACGITMNVCVTNAGRLFNIPNEIPTDNIEGRITDMQCGYEHAVLLTDQGKVYTWGGGSRCQLGHGTIDNVDHPKLVEALAGIDIVKIAAGGWHTCAISTFGDLYTWGWNDQGQLGIYSSKPSASNIMTDNIEDNNMSNDDKRILYDNIFSDNEFFDPVAFETSCSLKRTVSDVEENNELSSTTKKLKTNTVVNEDVSSESFNSYAIPQLIDILDSGHDKVLEYNIIDVSCGSKHSVIILDDGTVLGSGCNKYAQLGFDPKFRSNIQFFSPLNVKINRAVLKCGNWTTSLLIIE